MVVSVLLSSLFRDTVLLDESLMVSVSSSVGGGATFTRPEIQVY